MNFFCLMIKNVCSTAEFRNAFLKSIRTIIRESVRSLNFAGGRGRPLNPGQQRPNQQRRKQYVYYLKIYSYYHKYLFFIQKIIIIEKSQRNLFKINPKSDCIYHFSSEYIYIQWANIIVQHWQIFWSLKLRV